MDTDQLMQGVELMVLGMGIVVSFLTILVFTLHGMSRLAGRLDKTPDSDTMLPAPIDVSNNRQLVAVISAAVKSYRTSRNSPHRLTTTSSKAAS